MTASAASDSQRKIGYTLAVFSSISSGAATVLGKWNLEAISPMLMNALIFSVASLLLTAWVLPTHGLRRAFTLTKQGWIWTLAFAITSWLAIWAFWAGVQRMDPSLASFLNRTEVPIVILLGIIFLKERFTKKEIFGTLLAILGIVIMKATLRMEYTSGFWLVLIGSLFFGLTEFISKIAMRHVEPVILAYIRNLFLAIFYWIALFIGGYSFDGIDRVWPGVIALGFVGPILARMVYLYAIRRVEISKIAVISQSQPVFVMLISFLTLAVLPSVREVAGGIFLVAGCAIMALARARRRMARNSRNPLIHRSHNPAN